MRTTVLVLTAVSSLALACGRSDTRPDGQLAWMVEMMDGEAYREACDEVPGCGETRFEAPAATETVWRVMVRRSASGEVTIGSVDAVDVPEDKGVPVGPITGDAFLVGLNGSGDAVDGQLVRFPQTLRLEYAGENLMARELDLADREVSTVGYLRTSSSIETLAVQDASGATIASMPVPSRVASRATNGRWLAAGLASPAWAQRRPWEGLPPYCSHIIVLQGEEDRHLTSGVEFEDLITLDKPGPWQLATVQAALARMTPLLCQSLTRIAFGHVPEHAGVAGAVNSFGAGDMMMINLSARDDSGALIHSEEKLAEKLSKRLVMQRTVIHEAAHAAETLLTFQGARAGDYRGSWEAPARSLTDDTIARVRLKKGLPDEWKRLHESFLAQDWADYYTLMQFKKLPIPNDIALLEDLPIPQSRANWSAREIADAGFMSKYGAKNWAEDIATFVGHTYMSQPWLDALRGTGSDMNLREDAGCQEMQAYGEKNLPSRLAAVYTKLLFLRDLGVVAAEDVDDCIGSSLGLVLTTPGFHFWEGDEHRRAFGQGVTAKIGTASTGRYVFQMTAEGRASFDDREYPAKATMTLNLEAGSVPLDEVAWPRGVYPFGLLERHNTFQVRLDGKRAGNIDVYEGFALVAEASNSRIAGSVFMHKAIRPQAPLPVPQVFDPPMMIRFLIEK
jgi:hypothetical protein